MGNDNMVQNQKVFIRLERVLALQRVRLEEQETFNKHNLASKRDADNKEAYDAMIESAYRIAGVERVIALLELPITL